MYILIKERTKCVLFCFNWMIISFFTTTFKMVWHDPRPFWVNSKILVRDCDGSYGNPSGHCISAFGICIFIWLEYKAKCKQTWTEVLFGICCWVPALMTGYTSVIMGEHSFDQVLFGATIGLWVACTSSLIVGVHAKPHLHKIL